MPLLRYFWYVGSALVLLLFGLSWYFPQPVSERISSGTGRPVIRISSVEQLPERIVIDTSLPTIVPPPIVIDFAERWPVPKAIETNSGPKPTTPTMNDDVPKKQSPVKREPVKKVAAHRAAPPANNASASDHREQAAAPVTRLSLLDILKEQFGQNLFKLN
jgi:uncharacterized protein YbjT (DUF2867 family)